MKVYPRDREPWKLMRRLHGERDARCGDCASFHAMGDHHECDHAAIGVQWRGLWAACGKFERKR